jgi:hypothetical protein
VADSICHLSVQLFVAVTSVGQLGSWVSSGMYANHSLFSQFTKYTQLHNLNPAFP